MKLKRAALLAEIVGGLGIIISILYLAFEVSESADSQVISNQLALTDRLHSLNASLLENERLAGLIAKSRSETTGLTPSALEQVRAYLNSWLQIWEDVYSMHAMGDMPDDFWDVWSRVLCDEVSSPGFAALWRTDLYTGYSGSFIAVVNECVTQPELPTAAEPSPNE